MTLVLSGLGHHSSSGGSAQKWMKGIKVQSCSGRKRSGKGGPDGMGGVRVLGECQPLVLTGCLRFTLCSSSMGPLPREGSGFAAGTLEPRLSSGYQHIVRIHKHGMSE